MSLVATELPAKVTYTWGDTVVGEQLLPSAVSGETVCIPAAVLRQATEVRSLERLRPWLAPHADAPAPAVSVVVCTLERPEELVGCLASLAELRTTPYEIIVVNNDPSDRATRAVAEGAGATVLDEQRRGLSTARNTGIAAARGELVAFIDDDCRVDPSWLDGLAAEFAHPLIAACVGWVGAAEVATEAQWLFEAQGGFERRVAHAVVDGAQRGPWAASGFGDGNSIFRRSVFEAHGGFREDLGPGTPARSAQDAELFYRLLGRGLRVSYSPSRIVWHRHRRDLEPLAATLEGYMTGLAAHAARALVHDRDLAALKLWGWCLRRYFPRLGRDALREGSPDRVRLLAVQVRGAFAGPWRDRRGIRAPLAPAPIPALPSRPPATVAVTKELPGVSVLIASRNRRDLLVRALRALGAQRHPPGELEVVVVLDGSTDGSLQAASSLELPWPLRVEPQDASGLAVARNRGVAAATKSLLLFLDDDILAAEDLVLAHARAHVRRPVAIVMGRHPPVVPERSWWAQRLRGWWEDHFAAMLQPGWQPSFVDYADGNSSLLTSTFDRLGGFDEAFAGGRRQDWEMAARAFAAGIELRMEAAARAEHHADPSFAGTLRATRQEGIFDVLIARRHPLAAGRLPLAHLGRSRRGQLARELAERVGDDHWIALERALERSRARRAWDRVTGLALASAYSAGVKTAASPEEHERLLGPVRRDEDLLLVPINVEHPHDAPLRLTHPWRVKLALGDARLDATRPGLSWDAERVLADAASLVADREVAAGLPTSVAVSRGDA